MLVADSGPGGGVMRLRVLVIAVFALAALMLFPGLARTWSGEWAGLAEGATSGQRSGQNGDVGTRLHDDAKGFGESLLDGVKFVGRTVISPFTGTTGKVSRDADATGKRVHKGAKGFGDGLLDGLKYTGRKIGEFFRD
jgi:hypothetical protein